MFLFDTREKKNEHVKKYFEKHGIEYAEKALEIGDYMLYNGEVAIDRKKDLQELATNLFSPHDKGRFWREIRRAKEQGVKLIILCEQGGQIKQIADVYKWKNKYGKVRGSTLMNEIYRVHVSYGVEFLFCDKRSTGRLIHDILMGKLEKQ